MAHWRRAHSAAAQRRERRPCAPARRAPKRESRGAGGAGHSNSDIPEAHRSGCWWPVCWPWPTASAPLTKAMLTCLSCLRPLRLTFRLFTTWPRCGQHRGHVRASPARYPFTAGAARTRAARPLREILCYLLRCTLAAWRAPWCTSLRQPCQHHTPGHGAMYSKRRYRRATLKSPILSVMSVAPASRHEAARR